MHHAAPLSGKTAHIVSFFNHGERIGDRGKVQAKTCRGRNDGMFGAAHPLRGAAAAKGRARDAERLSRRPLLSLQQLCLPVGHD